MTPYGTDVSEKDTAYMFKAEETLRHTLLHTRCSGQYCSVVFSTFRVQISARRPTALAKAFRGVPRSLLRNTSYTALTASFHLLSIH